MLQVSAKFSAGLYGPLKGQIRSFHMMRNSCVYCILVTKIQKGIVSWYYLYFYMAYQSWATM